MRKSGILLPVASLESAYGIGSFSKKAYEWVDFLKEAGQTYWQILPLGPTGYGDSPYQSFSTFAGNPYFIDLDTLGEEGLLTEEELAAEREKFAGEYGTIDYEKVYLTRFKILLKAYERWKVKISGGEISEKEEFKQFQKESVSWLRDYALFMAIKNSMGGKSFIEWDQVLRLHDERAVSICLDKYADEVGFYEFQQFMFARQWKKLKDYANENGVKIIGDIPIYVAFDSADTWTHPELFQFDDHGYPIAVAGCPPDAFSATGQLWGNPLFRWDYHQKTHFDWWLKRLAHCYQLYDVVRIDHFRGFDEYYSIPYGSKDATTGQWEQGPGYNLFAAVKEELGEKQIIAEDLGFLTDTVIELVKKTGYPGMKILQFAFDSREESDYLPHNYDKNSVVYTGTHDNDTLAGWYDVLDEQDMALCQKYLNLYGKTKEEALWELIRAAHACVADTCIIPLQDYLGLGSEARINTPSTLGNNWAWQMKMSGCTKELAEKILDITKLYARA